MLAFSINAAQEYKMQDRKIKENEWDVLVV